jgi:TonB family protein
MTEPAGEQKQGQAADATTAAAGPLVVPVVREPAPSTGSDRVVRPTAWMLALVAHAAVLYALGREADDLMAGGGGQQLDAISVTIVSSAVLESRDLDQSQASAPASAARVEANEGANDVAAAAADQPEEKKQEREQERPPEKLTPTHEAIIEMPPQSERHREQEKSTASSGGGAAARGEAEDISSARGPAAASPGAAREYARHVSAALSRTKPKGGGIYGTVKIKFVLSLQGRLASAEVLVSSGNIRLDAMTLEAVRRAVFPIPPAGMTAAELTYEVPYRFR